ncbi:MAG: CHASE3 domain-containing protein [Gemmatimonadaceae bacterium]
MPASASPIQQRVDERRRKSDLPLNTKLSAVTAVAVLILIVGSLGVFLVTEYRGAEKLVTQTLEVQRTLASVLQRLTDAETGLRGLLITNAEEFLEPYNGAAEDVTGSIATLKQLVGDNPAQLREAALLDAAVKFRLQSLSTRLAEFRAHTPVDTVAYHQGKVQMDSVRSIIERMNAESGRLLLERQARSERQGVIAVAVILPGTLVAFALLMLITSAIRSDVQRREAAHAKIEEQNTELEAQSAILAEQQVELEQQLEESQVMTEELEATNEELQRITVVAEEEREAAETARDLYRSSDARYRFLADAIPVQVWTAARDGQLDFVSGSVAQYFGKSRDEVIGDGWLSVIHADDVSPTVERWTQSLATGEPYEVNFRLRKGDGTYRWHLGRALALRDDGGKITGWFGSNTDIDDQHRSAEQREHLVKTLERTNQELDQFAYVASHDLKAPLRGIANLSEWIEEDIGAAFPPDAKDKMELLRGRVRRLEGLIDGILEYSRAGRARKPPAAVDTNVLMHEIIEEQDAPASVRIDVASDLPTVFSERIPLQQVLSNLIGNAIKYTTRADAVINVTAATQGDFVRFSVADNGSGIAPQYHDRIFVVFQRLAARDKIEGTGIGLAIVKKIVEGRGGRVWVESPNDATTGSGTTFHFTWPRVPGREV